MVFDHRPEMGIVLLSGYTAGSLGLVDVLARGGRFVVKPFSHEELLSAVAAAETRGPRQTQMTQRIRLRPNDR